MGTKKNAAEAATPAAAATPVANRLPAIKLTRPLRFGTKRFGKDEVISPALAGLSADQVEWLIDSKSAEIVESEGGEA